MAATHIRTQIRKKLQTILQATATAGAHVFSNRANESGNPFDSSELPALNIENDTDRVTSRSVGSQVAPHAREEERTESFKIAAGVQASANVDDMLDQICLEVEQAIYADIFLGYPSAKLTTDARLINTTFRFDESGKTPVGIAEMVWEFDTWINNTNPTALQA